MADLGASNFSEVDGSNNTAAPDGMPEGMAPSGVNDTYRATAGALKRWWNRMIPKLTGGTSTAYTVSYTVAPTAYVDGETYLVRFNAASGAAPTLNINALGALPIQVYSGGAWGVPATGALTANMIGRVSYNSAAGAFFLIDSSVSAIGAAFLAVANTFTAVITMSAVAINEAQGTAIPSATTTDIGAALGNYVHVTGTTTITGLGTIQAGTRRKVVFDGILLLTHNGTSLICLGAANVTTAAGDIAEFESEGSGNWRMTSYWRATGAPLAPFAVGTQLMNSLLADVNLNNIANYFDGPSVAQGTVGTWFASGSVCVIAAAAGSRVDARLWDGTTVIVSQSTIANASGSGELVFSLSGFLPNPAANIRISVRNETVATGKMTFNASGNAKDCTISALRIG